ncbi:MAG: hypothetical protein WCG42_05850 [Parachlamydiaceae bacterium]
MTHTTKSGMTTTFAYEAGGLIASTTTQVEPQLHVAIRAMDFLSRNIMQMAQNSLSSTTFLDVPSKQQKII